VRGCEVRAVNSASGDQDMRPSLVLAVCLAINAASLLFQFIVFLYSGYENAGAATYTVVAILFNAQAWELASTLEKQKDLQLPPGDPSCTRNPFL
jgi:hypothetical protein